MSRYIEGRITLKKIEAAVEKARKEGFTDGLHTMHERYLNGEPHGIRLLDHKGWQCAKAMLSAIGEAFFGRAQ